MKSMLKTMMQIFFATSMVISWVTVDWKQVAGLFAIALAITSIDVGGREK